MDGTVFIDKLIEIKSRAAIFEKRRIDKGAIKTIGLYYREQPLFRWQIGLYSEYNLSIDKESIKKDCNKCPIAYIKQPPKFKDEFRQIVYNAMVKELKRRGEWEEPKEICGRALNEDGLCPAHGLVRVNIEKEETEKETKKEKNGEEKEVPYKPRRRLSKKRFRKNFDKT